jgi:hypothetical protein
MIFLLAWRDLVSEQKRWRYDARVFLASDYAVGLAEWIDLDMSEVRRIADEISI